MRSFSSKGLVTLVAAAFVAPAGAQCNSAPPPPGAPDLSAMTPTAPSPTTPTTPSPTTPSGPAPTTPGPTTPTGPRGPTTPGSGAGPRTPPRGPRGTPITFTRQTTSKELLALDWDLPVVAPDTDKGKHTVVARDRVAMPAAEAFKFIAGDDQRPLLVLRECYQCKGSDAALLRRTIGDERTQLLANWFHCVKLPPEVLQPNHPFRNLFPERRAPHMFLCRFDGSGRIAMTGNQKQTDIWKAMTKTIKASYKKSPKPALSAMMRYLSQFDSLDLMEQQHRGDIRKELIRHGDGTKVNRLRKKLETVQKKKRLAMTRAKAMCDLKLVVTSSK